MVWHKPKNPGNGIHRTNELKRIYKNYYEGLLMLGVEKSKADQYLQDLQHEVDSKLYQMVRTETKKWFRWFQDAYKMAVKNWWMSEAPNSKGYISFIKATTFTQETNRQYNTINMKFIASINSNNWNSDKQLRIDEWAMRHSATDKHFQWGRNLTLEAARSHTRDYILSHMTSETDELRFGAPSVWKYYDHNSFKPHPVHKIQKPIDTYLGGQIYGHKIEQRSDKSVRRMGTTGAVAKELQRIFKQHGYI